MTRTYRKAKRAEAQEDTRDRIVRATMALHLEQGVATTSYTDVAERAGVGAATVYRHFPTMGSLVDACGAHIWQQIEPPRPEDAAARFRRSPVAKSAARTAGRGTRCVLRAGRGTAMDRGAGPRPNSGTR